MVNIFKLHEYQSMHNMSKSDLPTINSVCKKVWFTINGQSKCYFVIFVFFHFPKFQSIMEKQWMIISY